MNFEGDELWEANGRHCQLSELSHVGHQGADFEAQGIELTQGIEFCPPL